MSGLYLASLDSPTRTRLNDAFSSVEYASAHLFYHRDGTLYAQRFDESAGRLVGDPFVIQDNIDYNSSQGRGAFSVSPTGTLAFRTSANRSVVPLTWFDRNGAVIGRVAEAAVGGSWRLSPDDSQLALSQIESEKANPLPSRNSTDVWQIDMARGVPSRVTFDAGRQRNNFPIWSPDGRWIVYSSDRKGKLDLYRRAAGGGGNEELLSESPNSKTSTDWSPDGKLILFNDTVTGGEDVSILALPLESRTPFPVVQSRFRNRNGAFAPDGRWFVYESNESGKDQIYVQPFPPTGRKWRLSTTDGSSPRWSRTGHEIFYVQADNRLMVVAVTVSAGEFQTSLPRELFRPPFPSVARFFDVSRDGQRFLLVAQNDEAADQPITVVMNWSSSLKK